MPELHKIRHILPANSWLAVYTRNAPPWHQIIPLSDRALVTRVDRDGDFETYSDAVIGMVAYGGYREAESIYEPQHGMIFAGYFNPLYSQAFPQFYDSLAKYVARVSEYAEYSFTAGREPQEDFQVPESNTQPVMGGFEMSDLEGEEEDVGIEYTPNLGG